MLAQAELVVEAEFASGRLTAVPLEGRACLAEWERGGQRLVLHTSTQVPHLVRTTVAGILGVDEHRVRVVAPDVGGGFGQKCVVAREEVLVCVAARAVGAPVKWVEDRVESLLAGFQGHQNASSSAPASTPRAACWPSTPTSWPTSAPTRRTRSRAASSR